MKCSKCGKIVKFTKNKLCKECAKQTKVGMSIDDCIKFIGTLDTPATPVTHTKKKAKKRR